jgi:hypothetical protein
MLAVVIVARVIPRAHMRGVPVRCCFTGAMHRARNSRLCRAAQRRDPRCEKNDDEVGGEKAANHGWQSKQCGLCWRKGMLEIPSY